MVGHLPDDSQAGVTHCFVNLGSDHPSIIEAIVKGQNEKQAQFPKIITCPKYFQIQQGCELVIYTDLSAVKWWHYQWLTAMHVLQTSRSV